METIAERIIKVVNALGGNKSDFARKINVTPAYISKLSKQLDKLPSERTISDICRVFKVSYDWIMTGNGEMFETLPQGIIEDLAEKFNLDEVDKRIISAYLNLSLDDRMAIKRYMKNFTEQ